MFGSMYTKTFGSFAGGAVLAITRRTIVVMLTLGFASDILNFVDLVAILPFYLDLLIGSVSSIQLVQRFAPRGP